MMIGLKRTWLLRKLRSGFGVQIDALVVHLEGQQVCDPLNVIAVGNALIAKGMGIVPDFGNELFVGR